MKIITIGRATTNNVVLQDNLVSGTHAQIIIKHNNCYSIVDLNSTNGTYVNNIRINGETILNTNDIIKIGNTIIPWQEYVNVSNKSAGIAPVGGGYSNNNNAQHSSPKEQKSGIFGYIVCCIITAILTGGIMGFIMYSTSKSKQQEIDTLDRQIAELNEQINEVEIDAINDQSAHFSKQLELQQDIEKQIAELKKTTSKLSEADKDNKELNNKIEGINKIVDELQTKLDTATSDLTKKEAALSIKDKELKEEQAKLKEAQEKLDTKQKELDAKQKELDTKQEELANVNSQLSTSNRGNNALKEENSRLQNIIEDYQKKTIPELMTEIESLKQQLATATAQTKETNLSNAPKESSSVTD